MRTYVISLSDLPSKEADQKFLDFIEKSKFEWWRYIPTTIVLATPDSISTNFLLSILTDCYGTLFFLVFEVNINDVGGVFPISKEIMDNMPKDWSPVFWFDSLKSKDYIPKWEK